jgi:hypothetical protein
MRSDIKLENRKGAERGLSDLIKLKKPIKNAA